MTSRHHAEEALRALRAVDLKPRGPLRAVEVEADVPRAHQACPQCGRKMVGGREQANGSDATIHDCPQCGELVCRRCLAISVFDKASGAVLRICRCAKINISMACMAPRSTPFRWPMLLCKRDVLPLVPSSGYVRPRPSPCCSGGRRALVLRRRVAGTRGSPTAMASRKACASPKSRSARMPFDH